MNDDRVPSDVAALLGSARRMLGALRADAARLDQRQLVSYELALASADLLAAETSVGPIAEADVAGRDGAAADSAPEDFDARLALVYAADAIGAVFDRLQAIGIELDRDLAALDRIAADPEWRALRRAAASSRCW